MPAGVYGEHSERESAVPRSKKAGTRKETRLSIRVDAAREAVIARAAERQGKSITDFVLDNAYQMASELLLDDGQASLSRKQVGHIFDVLDNPPSMSLVSIRKLLSEPSVFDG
jgi:uncharacterized protein (DUF1778 family)